MLAWVRVQTQWQCNAQRKMSFPFTARSVRHWIESTIQLTTGHKQTGISVLFLPILQDYNAWSPRHSIRRPTFAILESFFFSAGMWSGDNNHVHFLFSLITEACLSRFLRISSLRMLGSNFCITYSIQCFLSISSFCFRCHLIPILSFPVHCPQAGPFHLFWSGFDSPIVCVLPFSTHAQFLRMRKGGLFLCDFDMC